MSTATYQLPNFTTMSAAEYKAAIDAMGRVFERSGDRFAAHEQTIGSPIPDLTVRVDAGWTWDGTTLSEIAAQTVSGFTASGSNTRIDRVVYDELTGVASRVAGVDSASPVAPAIPAGKTPIAQVGPFTTSTTSITNSMITNERAQRLAPSGVTSAGKNIIAHNNATTPNTKLDISADEVQLTDSNGSVLVVKAVSGTIDFGTVGANGIDTGSQSASTWYYGWVIAKPDGTKAVLGSLSATAPTMPSGYSFKALVTAARSNGSTQFIPYDQLGNDVHFRAGQSVLSSGTATSSTSVSVSTVVPGIAQAFTIDPHRVQVTSDGGGDFNHIMTVQDTSGTDRSVIARIRGRAGTTAAMANRGSVIEMPNLSQQFYYYHTVTFGTSPQADINVLGFKLPIGGE